MQAIQECDQIKPRILNVWSSYDCVGLQELQQWVVMFENSPFLVTTLFLNGDPSEYIESVIGGDSLIFMNFGPRPSFIQRQSIARELQALNKLTPFDLVLVHDELSEIVCSRLGKKNLIKVRVRHRSGEFGSMWSRMIISNRAWPQISTSNWIASEIMQKIPSLDLMNIGTVYPFIEQDKFKNQLIDRDRARAILGLLGSDFVFANIGRLEPESNHKILLESFAQILREHTYVKLVLIGKGSLQTELKMFAKSLGIDENVRFYSALPDLHRLYRGFDRLVACGQNELLSLEMLAAMATGLPMCVTKNGGLKEAVEGVGMLVNAGDARALYQRMDSLLRLDSSHLASTRKAMADRLQSQFSLYAVRRQFWQLEFIKPVWKALDRLNQLSETASDFFYVENEKNANLPLTTSSIIINQDHVNENFSEKELK